MCTNVDVKEGGPQRVAVTQDGQRRPGMLVHCHMHMFSSSQRAWTLVGSLLQCCAQQRLCLSMHTELRITEIYVSYASTKLSESD